MKNWIKYYYDIDVENIKKMKNEYKFTKNGVPYLFALITREAKEIIDIYDLTNKLHKLNIPCHQILVNKDNSLITIIDDKQYILMRKYINSNDLITISDIINFSKLTSFEWKYQSLDRTNWKELWEQKIDYFEYQLGDVGIKYPNLASSFGYYEGITENALQLIDLLSNQMENSTICVAHKRINCNMTITEFYNPINFIIDYSVRDIAEYLKQKNSIFPFDSDIIVYLFKTFIVHDVDKILFIIRNFFPSFYFDAYEDILAGLLSDETILSLIDKNKNHEKMIKKIYAIVSTYVKMPRIDWIQN